ncbi:hypothetical protein ACP3TN_14715 [Staphylococcus sp. IPLA37011]|uniref:hypothetical protein n=1 Tax=Staphylococcus TaxID=1279 RepID=UPI0025529B24|nr:hypothetical protein [Staphylococcus equorum]MDK9873026.1 hypothetical protein [Staphylococcus equorum]
MNREDYFLNALKIIDQLDKYEWSDIPLMTFDHKNIYKILNYYDTRLGQTKNNELYLGFLEYSYYLNLDEYDNTLLSDYALIFYTKEITTNNPKLLLFMNSKEYNTFMMEQEKSFETYSLSEVIRKISEKEMNVQDIFKDL